MNRDDTQRITGQITRPLDKSVSKRLEAKAQAAERRAAHLAKPIGSMTHRPGSR